MANPLKAAIQERIRKLRMLEELADDPEAMGMLREILGSTNGNGHKSNEKPAPEQLSMKVGPNRGEQLATVEKVLASATSGVTTAWIVQQMLDSGYVFAASKPNVAVNESLRTLRDKGRARVKSVQGLENIWEYVANSHNEEGR